MRIRRHQLHPVVKGDFEEVTSEQTVIPKFSFEYYNNHVDHFNISPTGVINFPVGLVTFTMPEIQSSQLQILNEEELIALRWSFQPKDYSTEDTINIASLIYPNGKISLYYEKIPTEIQEEELDTLITGEVMCNSEPINPEITVPSKWIKSGTLVEFEVIRTLCSIHTTKEACRKVTPLDTTCIWCGKAGECIESNDQDTHMLKVNDCNDETGSEVNASITQTHIEETERTSDVNDVQVEENLQEPSKENAPHLVNI
uniref:Egg protein CP391S-like protein n=1 Tax=Schistosoma mansoni TaxID=6183 RepID=A0A5K4EZN9_SCHMA